MPDTKETKADPVVKTEQEDPSISTEQEDPSISTEQEDPSISTTKKDIQTKLNDELSEIKIEAKKNYDQMLRTKAELENYKKRISKEMEDLRRYSLESIMRELLTIVDNLERAILSSKEDKKNIKSIVKGIELTLSEMLKMLEAHNVKPIKSIGKLFDPKTHQAVSQEATSKHPSNTVIKEFFKGYMIHNRLLRPAMVVVSKKPEKNKSEK